MADKQPPFVAVRTDIRKDERVNVIADVGGYNRHEAMGRLLDMWSWCSDRKLADAPDDCDGYAVPEAVVRRFLGVRGVEAILGDGCDELALGARWGVGLIYLRGTSETVSRLRWGLRNARRGGVARSGGTRSSEGHYVTDNTTSQPTTSPEPSLRPAQSPACDTSVTSEIPQTTNHKPQEEDTERATSVAGPIPGQAKRAPRKRKTRIPDDWVPAPEQRAQAAAAQLDCDEQAKRFVRHYRASGKPYVNWDETFAAWLERSLEFQARNRAGPSGSQAVLGNLMNDIARLEREETERGA